MIKNPERIVLPTVGDDKIEIFCNWNDRVNGDFLKLVINDGDEHIIPRSALSKVAFWLASEEEQEAMVPTKTISIRHFVKDIVIKIPRHMKQGELLRTKVGFEIPLNGDQASLLNPFKN